jgi:RNA polymerase subunit RPABC4/transcription elongation factor Spt4
VLNDLVGEGVVTAMILAAKLGFAYIAIMWVALIYWTFRDIRRRTRDPILQAIAVSLTTFFFLPGYWLYLVLRPRLTLSEIAEEHLREALFAEYSQTGSCPKCRKHTRDEYVICPHCQESLRSSCQGCSRALLANWKACPYCSRPAPRSASRPVVPAAEAGTSSVGAGAEAPAVGVASATPVPAGTPYTFSPHTRNTVTMK